MEIGLKEVLEQISARLNHIETRLEHVESRLDALYRDKADKWEMRIWSMTIMVLLGAILGTIITRL